MTSHRFVKATQLFVTVSLSRLEESLRFLTRVPRDAAGEVAVQRGDVSMSTGRRVFDATGASLRAVGRGVTEVGRVTGHRDGE